MPSLIRIHRGIALCMLILGTTTMLCSQNAHQQQTNGEHRVAPVEPGAGPPGSDADAAQQRRSKTGTHPDNSAVNPVGGGNAIPQSAAEPSPRWPQLSAPSDREQAQKLQPALGTAVASAPAVLPMAAAEPRGTAVAPAKQRRVRKIVLKVGVLVAAGAALSAVLILSETTASKPAVAH